MHAEQLSPVFFFKTDVPHCLFFIYKHAAFYMEAWLCCVANTFLDKIHLYSVIAEDLGVVIINRVSSRRSLSRTKVCRTEPTYLVSLYF